MSKGKAMWTSVEVAVGHALHRARYRVEGDVLVLEWRGGREVERYGQLKPEVVATARLKRLVAERTHAA
jgi:hypothetical protein